MAIQLPYTSEDDMMSGVLQRVEQRRYANQQRNDENLRYKDAQARADEAMKYDKEKFDWSKEMAREQLSLENQRIGAANKQNELQQQKQQFELDQMKTLSHLGDYTGKMLGAITSTSYDIAGKRFGNLANVSSFYKNDKGETFFDKTAFSMRPFSDSKKEMWWTDYSANAAQNNVKPSRMEFERLYQVAEASQNQRIATTVKDWGTRLGTKKFAELVKGSEYNSWASNMNASATDPTQVLPLVGEAPKEHTWWDTAGKTGMALSTAWSATAAARGLNREFREVPKHLDLFKKAAAGNAEAAASVEAWMSKATDVGKAAMTKTAGVDGQAVKTVAEGLSKLGPSEAKMAVSQLAKTMPKSGIISLAKYLYKLPYTAPIATALLAAAGIYSTAEAIFGDEN